MADRRFPLWPLLLIGATVTAWVSFLAVLLVAPGWLLLLPALVVLVCLGVWCVVAWASSRPRRPPEARMVRTDGTMVALGCRYHGPYRDHSHAWELVIPEGFTPRDGDRVEVDRIAPGSVVFRTVPAVGNNNHDMEWRF